MNNQNWKISIEQYGCKYSIELDHGDASMEEVYESIRGVLGASGWAPSLVKEILNIEDDEDTI